MDTKGTAISVRIIEVSVLERQGPSELSIIESVCKERFHCILFSFQKQSETSAPSVSHKQTSISSAWCFKVMHLL